jgi:hypothetical protein
MKSKTFVWVWLTGGLLWVLVALRDILAPSFFTMRPRVMGKLEIAMEFVAGAGFLIVAGLFYRENRRIDNKQK